MDYLNFEIKDFKQVDTNYEFEGYAAVFGNKDYGDDIIEKNAFKDSLCSDHNVKILWQHDMTVPVGVPTSLYEDANGLYIKGIMPKDDKFVNERVMPQLKIGSLELSIGYKVEDKSMDKNIRHIKKAFVYEVSLVSIGMNNKAKILKYKSLTLDNIHNINERDLEAQFKSGFKASNQIAKLLVSLIKSHNRRDVDKEEQREADTLEILDRIKNKKMFDYIRSIKSKYK